MVAQHVTRDGRTICIDHEPEAGYWSQFACRWTEPSDSITGGFIGRYQSLAIALEMMQRQYGGRSAVNSPEPPINTRIKSTSQKRDNQRAERQQQRERYHNAANDQTTDVAAIVAEIGFTVAEERDCDGTPVTIWHDAHGLATIKQTPYTIRIYNGRPRRLGKTADAGFTYRVEFGWQPNGAGTGEAAGVAALIAASIEIDEQLGGYGYIANHQAMSQQYPPISGGSHDHEPVIYRATLYNGGPAFNDMPIIEIPSTARGGEAVAAQYRRAVKRVRRQIAARCIDLGIDAPATDDHTYIRVERIRPGHDCGELTHWPIEANAADYANAHDYHQSMCLARTIQDTNAY